MSIGPGRTKTGESRLKTDEPAFLLSVYVSLDYYEDIKDLMLAQPIEERVPIIGANWLKRGTAMLLFDNGSTETVKVEDLI